MSAFNAYLTREQLAERWRVSPATLRRLESRNVLTTVALPGRRSGQYRLSDVQQLERQYSRAGTIRQPDTVPTPESVLADRDRAETVWFEFRAQCSPLDELYAALERAVAVRLASDATFTADDLETFVAEKKSEYGAVLAHAARQRQGANAAPELLKMAGAE